ncbi:MAG: TonB-dependent receptor [Gemmatimonadota bacterium]
MKDNRIRSTGVLRAAVLLLLGASSLIARPAAAQATGELQVRVLSEGGDEPIGGAEVRVGAVGSLTDERGEARLTLPSGEHLVAIHALGHAPETAPVVVGGAAGAELVVRLEVEAEEVEGIVVRSTRTDRRIEDEPIRVEVIAGEEIEEKVMMTPGDIAMMLNETSGLRVQNTSPSLGGANVRIQGLRGRYTQILSDGLPLYGGQSGSLSMLQIPPMDLGQVEVIKGVASALYGSTALGGVINLISRRPEPDEREVLLNQSTLGGTDGVLWLADEPGERWGYTFLGGLHRQSKADVDEDGWADLPGYRRAVVRPRVFWNDGAGRSVFVTMGGTVEEREGGTQDGRLTPGGTQHPEELETQRMDVGLMGRILTQGERLVTVRASAMAQRHAHRFGDVRERDLHANGFAEIAYSGAAGPHSWLIGAALQHESYDAEDVDGFDFGFTVPSVFVQDEYAPATWLTVAGSARFDRHSEYGAFINPRVSVLFRPGEAWNARASVGTGYFAPTPFTEESEAVGLGRVLPMEGVGVERAHSASLDIGREFSELELNATAFGSLVEDPVQVEREGAMLRLGNALGPTRTWGGELLARWHAEPFHVTATYTHLRSTEAAARAAGRREVPLTPRNTAGIVGMWESEGTARVGIELYYTGRQELEENPYRTTSRPYFVTGLLVERRVGRARFFVNAENILDARQTRYDPLVLPARLPEGRWTTDAWAPLEGRAINAGIRYEF